MVYRKYYSVNALLCRWENAKCWQQLLGKEKENKGAKSAFVDKTPLSLHWPEISSVILAAVLPLCDFPPPCYLAALLIWRCCLEAPVEPDPLLCLAMSSLTHGLLLCVPPSAFGGCPSPPWENTKQSKTKPLHAFWHVLESIQHIAWLNHKAYLSCRRQLCRLLRGSLFTEVDGFSNSSNREAGTGQSGILTGVTGFDGFPSLFSSMRCCSNKTIITGKYFITNLYQAIPRCHGWTACGKALKRTEGS